MAKRRGRPGPVVTVTVEQREILERYARGRTVPRALALRARIILDAAAGKPQVEIKRELRITSLLPEHAAAVAVTRPTATPTLP